jgi:PEP-CTERM motif
MKLASILLTALSLGSAFCAHADPIVLVPNTVNMFRDTRAANNINNTAGDRFQYGADISGGSLGTSVSIAYTGSNFTSAGGACGPLAVNANFCSSSTAYNANRTSQPWNITFARVGETSVTVAAPSVSGASAAVPFPVDVTISGSGTTPTISWTVPNGFNPDAIRINVYDRSTLRLNGAADVIHSGVVSPNNSAYALPSTLSSGQTLKAGGDYVFGIQLIDTRNDPAIFLANNSNAEILRRSNSYFNFTPLSANGPVSAALPSVANGVYNFAVSSVGPNSVTFIDPIIAVGYDYATGAGDPNFASVTAPSGIGDNLYDLFTWNGTAFVDSGIDIVGGTQYFFGAGGVSQFSLRGIEIEAGLDPNNVAAFITGLTFVSAGSFTGTMTPLTVEVTEVTSDVPLPSSFALLGIGAFGFLLRLKTDRFGHRRT